MARSNALKGVLVEAVPVEHFYNWNEAFKKTRWAGQNSRSNEGDGF